MELSPEQFKEWTTLLLDFTWPVILVIVLIVYRDVVAHFLKTIIDLIAKLFGLNR